MSFKSWNKTTLSDMMDIIGGGTPKTTIEEYWNGDINWISVKDFNGDSKYILDTEKTITKLGLDKSSTKLLEKDDIIISARGTVGALSMISKPMAFNQSCYGLRAKSHVNSDFLFYLLKNSIIILQNNTHGSVFSTITRNTFDTIEVAVPDIREQKAIANILSSLDDKIELNNQMNETLEEMAQALFKQWFVDFEFPNDEGQPYKSSGGEMIESELGMIPKEWNVNQFTDQVSIQGGGTPKTSIEEYWNGDIPFFTPKDCSLNSTYVLYTEKNITELGLEKCSSKLYAKNTIFITARGTVGRVVMAGGNMAMNQSCYALLGQENISSFYVYYLTKSIVDRLKKGSNGSVFNSIVTSTFSNIKIIQPGIQVIKDFDNKVNNLFECMCSNLEQNNYLIQLRDTLLPKLMSGEIRVSDLEE